jgi:RNA polymerase-interacting CarD/CdnL/TRCF family regulator
MSVKQLKPGDQVCHPMYGFGVVEGLTTQEQAGQSSDYYGVRLPHVGILSVPVARAEALGLRRVVNSLTIIATCLHSKAYPLPENDRLRAVELKSRWRSPLPEALAQGVRDLVRHSRTRRLTPGDKKWLASACERLSVEASLVDIIELVEARAAIQRVVDQLKTS